MDSHFPWDKVKADTLRTLCKDLGLAARLRVKREYMVKVLTRIEEKGLDVALQEQDELVPTSADNKESEAEPESPVRRSGRPRNSEPGSSAGTKRGLESPRTGLRSSSQNKKRKTFDGVVIEANKPTTNGQKRGRGRPRKKPLEAEAEAEAEEEGEAETGVEAGEEGEVGVEEEAEGPEMPNGGGNKVGQEVVEETPEQEDAVLADDDADGETDDIPVDPSVPVANAVVISETVVSETVTMA